MTDPTQPSPNAAVPPPPFPVDACDDAEENEVLRETRELEAQKKAAAAAEASSKRGMNWKTAAGIGIGSAALLAALLYASRDKD